MFEKILVAIDRSEMSRQGFSTALALARAMGGQLTLLHVLSVEDEESPHMPTLFGQDFYPKGSNRSVAQIYEDLWKAYEARGTALLRSQADEAMAAGITPEITQGLGRPGPTICEFAQKLGADLIVLGRQGDRTGLSEFLLGSVSSYVLHHAPCSVLVVVPPGHTTPVTNP
jgi:nucleotide-binding universal stress UspA family protein